MFEYHGWITIREGTNESEEDSDLLEQNVALIKETIPKYSEGLGRIELFYQNGFPFVRLDGNQNHYQTWVLELFVKISQLAKGSYGLLYFWDDEDPKLNNEFQVWRMTKGRVEKMKDLFLSPCNPTLETS